MKKKIFSIFVAVLLFLPCLVLAGCGKSSYETISRVPYQPGGDYWVEYTFSGTNNQINLYSYAKKTVGNTSYYYTFHNNNGAFEEYVAVVNNTNNSFTAYVYDYPNSTWINNTEYIYSCWSDGTPTWFDFETSFLSGYLSMAEIHMFNSGEINSLIRHEDGTEVTDDGIKTFHLEGIPGHVEAEDIEALHFYDSQNDEHYYFVQNSGVVLRNDYNRDYKAHVYKTEFTFEQVITAHSEPLTGLPTLP
ncbi:MAG: hypothetical protein IK070_01900 [Clostridia bacterium]|nr:hypothetical protein [Clostridia bacterium]